MATEGKLDEARSGGGRTVRSKELVLALTSGHVGVTGTGSITGGSGGTNGTYPLIQTGGTAGPGGDVAGTFTVAAGAVSAITITSPGDYPSGTPPTGFNFGASGVSGASVASVTTSQLASAFFNPPPGSRIDRFVLTQPAAIGGSPTNANISVGKSFGDASYVAAVDLKAQGKTSLTPVAAGLADGLNWPSAPGSGQALYAEMLIVGVTVGTGTATLEVFYSPPTP